MDGVGCTQRSAGSTGSRDEDGRTGTHWTGSASAGVECRDEDVRSGTALDALRVQGYRDKGLRIRMVLDALGVVRSLQGCRDEGRRSSASLDVLSGVRGSRGAETRVQERGLHACSQPSGMTIF
jgi:hypothetical protein